MASVFEKSQSIRNFILKNVVQHPVDIATLAAKEFGLSRQSITRHIRKLVEEQVLVSTGNTKARVYQLNPSPQNGLQVILQVDDTLEEDEVWRSYIRPQLEGAPKNVVDICEFGFTEMLNNVIDHSQARQVLVKIQWEEGQIRLFVVDDGVGIFRKLQKEFGFTDPRHAILELSKGKLTTKEASHTGQGIFFTSKMFDWFHIGSGGIGYGHGYKGQGIVVDSDIEDGTGVSMQIQQDAPQSQQEIFNEFASSSNDWSFSKTWLTLSLAQYEQENLVSRSQAKRVLARIDQFKEVALDFTGVGNIGPSFADEIFRVFARQHPEIRLLPIGENPDVERIIQGVIGKQS